MIIEELNHQTGYITLSMNNNELRTITNLLHKARNNISFSRIDYRINAELLTAITVLNYGKIPDFERKETNELYEKAGIKEGEE